MDIWPRHKMFLGKARLSILAKAMRTSMRRWWKVNAGFIIVLTVSGNLLFDFINYSQFKAIVKLLGYYVSNILVTGLISDHVPAIVTVVFAVAACRFVQSKVLEMLNHNPELVQGLKADIGHFCRNHILIIASVVYGAHYLLMLLKNHIPYFRVQYVSVLSGFAHELTLVLGLITCLVYVITSSSKSKRVATAYVSLAVFTALIVNLLVIEHILLIRDPAPLYYIFFALGITGALVTLFSVNRWPASDEDPTELAHAITSLWLVAYVFFTSV